MYVLQNENPAAWAELLDICMEQFRPATRYEQIVVEEIAFAKWRLRRLWTMETALLDTEMDEQAEVFVNKYANADESVRKAHAFKSLADKSNTLEQLNRYQTRLERSCERSIKSLHALKAAEAQAGVSEPIPAPVSTTEGEQQPVPETAPQTENAKRTQPVHRYRPVTITTGRNKLGLPFVVTNGTEMIMSPIPSNSAQIAPAPHKDVA
jgi:hypothetical protein